MYKYVPRTSPEVVFTTNSSDSRDIDDAIESCIKSRRVVGYNHIDFIDIILKSGDAILCFSKP